MRPGFPLISSLPGPRGGGTIKGQWSAGRAYGIDVPAGLIAPLAKRHDVGMRGFLLGLFCALSLFVGPARAQSPSAAIAPLRAAVFDFEWIDTSLEGAQGALRQDEQQRLRELGERLRRELAASGRFELVDITPVAAEARGSNLQACGGCDARMAKVLGARLAITGTVQKVSNLILNINIYMRDAETGRLLFVSSADMRGNTEESWTRTLDWLVKNRLLAEDTSRVFGSP